MRILLAALSLFAVACEPPCLRGHRETRRVPAMTTFIFVGKVLIPQFHPAHDTTVFVCDQYQVEKP